jgi:hypothetical protein
MTAPRCRVKHCQRPAQYRKGGLCHAHAPRAK